MSVVLDSSLTLSWMFRDEQSTAGTELLDRVVRTGAVVPSLWRLEVANALLVGVRRKRLTAAERDDELADLGRLRIDVDDQTDDRAWSSTLRLAEQHGLTAYDAAYLELASRRRLPLASLDQRMRDAAGAVGVAIL